MSLYNYEATLVGDPDGYHYEVEVAPALMSGDSETYTFPASHGLSKASARQAYENAIGLMDWYIRQIHEKKYRLDFLPDDEERPDEMKTYDFPMKLAMETVNGQSWDCVAWVLGTDSSAITNAEPEAIQFLEGIKSAIIAKEAKGIL